MRGARVLLLVTLSCVGPSANVTTGAQIYDLGSLGGFGSKALGLSSNGIVVGVSGSPQRAFRWTSATGIQNLESLAGDPESSAHDVSADGNVVVGNTFAEYEKPMRWTASDGMTALPTLTGYEQGAANRANADGTVIVGYLSRVRGGNSIATVWSSGSVRSLGSLGGASSAYDVSDDGAVVVGNSQAVDNSGPSRAFRSTSAGMQNLGVLSGAFASSAYAVSGDGQTVAGISWGGTIAIKACIWNSGNEVTQLADLPACLESYALGVSDDGSVVVGFQNLDTLGYRASIWFSGGAVNLNEYLPSIGIDTTDWILEEAYAISGGPTEFSIVGSGLHSDAGHRAFLVTGVTLLPVPEPSTYAMALAGLACGGFSMWRRRKRARRHTNDLIRTTRGADRHHGPAPLGGFTSRA